MFVKHRCPQVSGNKVNIFKSHILTKTQPKGYVISGKYEQPLDELTVKVWSQYDHQTLNIALSM